MDLPLIPNSISVFLDAKEISKVQRTIDDFFVRTKEYIESIHDVSKPHEFLIISGQINRIGLDSADRLTYLFYDNRYVVVGVVETRTEFNNLRYTFFRDLSCLEDKFT